MSMVGSLIAHVCMHARLALQYVTDKQQLGILVNCLELGIFRTYMRS